ncbi:MAG: hypothetical protein AAB019_01580, partial [Planctomycetota bacterium]
RIRNKIKSNIPSTIGLISAAGKPDDMNKKVYVPQHPRVYAHVYTAGLLLQGTDDDVDLEIYSYGAGWKITNQGAKPKPNQEYFNAPVGDDVELEPDRVSPGHYWNVLDDDGIWAVDSKAIEYDETDGEDQSESVVSVAGGELVVRLWEDLPGWTGLRPPGWMMDVVNVDIDIDGVLLIWNWIYLER